MDKFPAEQQRILRDLEKRIARLEEIARTIAPIPITRASGNFDIPEGSPSAPESGVRLGASSGRLVVRGAGSSSMTLPLNNVSNPPNFSSPSVQSGEFASGAAYTALRADCAALHDSLRDLMNEMRGKGWLQ